MAPDIQAWLAAHPAPPPQKRPRSFEINFSMLRAFLECPWEYKLRFIDRVPQPPSPASSLGMTIHRALESFHREDGADLGRLLELYDRHFHHAGYPDDAMKAQWRRKGEAILKRYWRDETGRRTRVVSVEREFAFGLGPHSVRGMIDRIDEHPDGRFEVIDYKTGPQGEAEESVFFQDLQLRIYGLGAREGLALSPAWLTIHYVATGHRRTVEPNPGEEEELEALLWRAADLMAAGRHMAPDTSFCPDCVFRRTCPLSVARG